MDDIHGIHPAAAAKPIEPTGPVAGSTPAPAPAGVSDSVEISPAARLAARVHEVPEVRTELVQSVKAEIAAGIYETPERLEIAVNRLMEELLL